MAAAAATALAACSPGAETPEASPSPEAPEATEEVTEEPAEDVGAFFDGKTITLLVPYNPGAGFDQFARLLAPEIEKQLDGVRVTVENRPGGGGLVGANEIWQAEPDGLTIGIINFPGAVFAEATDTAGVEFNNSDWTFFTRVAAINPIVYTGADSGYESFESILESEEPVKFGLGGVGSDAYYATVVMSEVLGFPTEIVAGYPGNAEADAALLVGEVDAAVGSITSYFQRMEGTGTHVNVLISTEPDPTLPDVPIITEYGDADQKEILTALASIYDLERVLVGPPGIDEARAQFLAEAIYAAATAGKYEEDTKAAGLVASPMERSEVTDRAATAMDSIDLLTPYVKGAGS